MSRLIGYDSQSGLAKYWHEDGEGNWAQESVQDCTPVLDLNKEAQNHCDPYNADRDIRIVARIPLIVIELWRQRYGVDYWSPDPDVQHRIDRILADPEWRWLRVDLGNANNVFVSSSQPLVLP